MNPNYLPYLEKELSPKRLQHSLGVMGVMRDLAPVYGLDPEQAITAGLLHDAAKDLSPERQAELVREAGIQIQYPCETDYVLYLHGPVGAYLVEKELGVRDLLVLESIRSHCYTAKGEAFDSPLAWCLRFADILEPGRVWDVRWFRDGGQRLRQAVYSGRLAEGAFLQTGWLMRMFEEKGFAVHPNHRQSFQQFASQLGWDEKQLELED
jgi:predicted HD superfamily hydrolase involved in NAD metabolism